MSPSPGTRLAIDRACAPRPMLPVGPFPRSPDWARRRPGESFASFLLRAPVLPVAPWLQGIVMPEPEEESPPLRDRLIAEASRVIGSNDHFQVAGIITKAASVRIDARTTEALALAVQHRTATVERNLDLIDVPEKGIWFEWPDAARYRKATRDGAAHPLTSGALVVPFPGRPRILVALTGWMLPDGRVRHSYAVAYMDLDVMARHAWEARNRWSGDNVSALQRLQATFDVRIPPGLGEELEFLIEMEVTEGDGARGEDEIRETAHAHARLDVAPDIPFILGALILHRSPSAVLLEGAAGTRLSYAPHPPRLMDRARALLGRPVRDGFVRRGVNEDASVTFVRTEGSVRPVRPRAGPAPSLNAATA